MIFVKVREFAHLSPEGILERLQCKLCGVVIGERQHRTIGFRTAPNGQKIERVVENFTRNHLYYEIKIAFEDGSAHVTNGCKNCLGGDIAVEVLDELTWTDEQDLRINLGRKALEVVERKLGGGIV